MDECHMFKQTPLMTTYNWGRKGHVGFMSIECLVILEIWEALKMQAMQAYRWLRMWNYHLVKSFRSKYFVINVWKPYKKAIELENGTCGYMTTGKEKKS
jgi:hypothetical protein